MRQHTITTDDINKHFIEISGVNYSLRDSIGYIQAQDVGKRLYIYHGIIKIESTAQYRKRTFND